MADPVRHRPGALKQVNKPYKTKHSTKGEIKRRVKGRAAKDNVSVVSSQVTGAGRKDRRQRVKDLIKNQRAELLSERRIGSSEGAPKIIGIVSMGEEANAITIRNNILKSAESVHLCSSTGAVTFIHTSSKQRFTILAPPRDLVAVLDTAKVADLVCLAVPVAVGVDSLGELFLSSILAQGCPSVMGLLSGLADVDIKRRTAVRKQYQGLFKAQFPHEPKVLPCDSESDYSQIIRFLGTESIRDVHWRLQRPYMLAEKYAYVPNAAPSAAGEEPTGTLLVSGYLRGAGLSANHLVQLVNYGTYQLKQIDLSPDPNSRKRTVRINTPGDSSMGDESAPGSETIVMEVADPDHQESLDSEVVPDPLAGEQTWPTEDEMADARSVVSNKSAVLGKKKLKKKLVPKGFSDYQAAWIASDDEKESDEEDDEDDEDDEEDEVFGANNPAFGNTKPQKREKEESEDEEDLEEREYIGNQEASTSKKTKDVPEVDLDMDDEEEESWEDILKARKAARGEEDEDEDEAANELKYPDEVECPPDVPARIRFQKYRGLKSFRSSPWDPKENLPLDYARLVQFESFERAKKRVLREHTGIETDSYYTIHIANVPASFMEKYDPTFPLVVFGLLKYEQKMSVVNFFLQRHPNFTEAIRSKSELLFSVGPRTFFVNPLFSQHSPRSDKHKFERFFQPGHKFICASAFMPITFTPCPVLVFKLDPETGAQTLVGHGSVMDANPDRIMLKKIVLSGFTIKVAKRKAVVRYMFYNPEDVAYFKPLDVYTKYGLTGNIIDSIGTHGRMKCQFDDALKHNDTVCLNLYKRIYPKWNTKQWSMLG